MMSLTLHNGKVQASQEDYRDRQKQYFDTGAGPDDSESTQPNLQLIKEECITDVTVIHSLDCKDHGVLNFKILRERRKANSML